MYHISYLLLGSNLGARDNNLLQARELIDSNAGRIIKCSSIYETEPWNGISKDSETGTRNSEPGTSNPKPVSGKEDDFYLNQVIQIETSLEPHFLLDVLMKIEKELGRSRTESPALVEGEYEPRTIDIDILFYDDIIIDSQIQTSNKEQLKANNEQRTTNNDLKIPHPLIQDRRFVLVPLNEIAPGHTHPVLKKSIKQLLEETTDLLEVKIYNRG